MCGHSFHDRCIVSESKGANRSCWRCKNNEDTVKAIDLRRDAAKEAIDIEKFDKRL